MNNGYDDESKCGKTPWSWRGDCLPYGEPGTTATIFDADGKYVGHVMKRFAERICDAVNGRAEQREGESK